MLRAMIFRANPSFARLLTAAALLCAFSAQAGAPVKRPVIIELFTSQGCSSCPPADALLAKLSKRPGVLAMSLPVTYWDMLGWKDTLASEANTRRQKAYAATMGQGAVYTPQIIVDGVTDVVGNRESAVESAIDASGRGDAGDDIAVWMNESKQTLHIAIPPSSDRAQKQPATVWLIHLRGQATVAINGGENSGHTMTYHNVVADLRAVGQWKGEALSVDLPRSELEGLPHDGVAVVVQRGGYGHVVGAALLDHPQFYPQL
jgi:hypothetical protein